MIAVQPLHAGPAKLSPLAKTPVAPSNDRRFSSWKAAVSRRLPPSRRHPPATPPEPQR